MSIIKPHHRTLYGQAGEYDIALSPLCDEHLPLLYQWNADPEVVYWSDGPTAQASDEETVRQIYRAASGCGYCFLVEANGIPIGECLLCEVNVKSVAEKYPEYLDIVQTVTKKYPQHPDIRRIDTLIGEKEYWGRGIGSAFVRMLVDFAFTEEKTDMLYCFAGVHNPRSIKAFTKNGFEVVDQDENDVHLALTRSQYIKSCRACG